MHRHWRLRAGLVPGQCLLFLEVGSLTLALFLQTLAVALWPTWCQALGWLVQGWRSGLRTKQQPWGCPCPSVGGMVSPAHWGS